MEETQVKQIKITATNIKNTLFKYNRELIKLKKDRVKFNQLQRTKGKISGEETALEKRSIRSSLKNVGQKLLSGPRSLIDKFKEFFGLILLGILVNNLPKIVKKLQEVFGKIKSFLDNNPWIMDAVKFGFKIIGDGIMALAKLIKDVKPFLGGTFQFALSSIRSTKDKIGDLIKTFDDLERTALGMFSIFGLSGDEEKQAKAELEGKYYSSTTKKTYPSYSAALKDPAVRAVAIKPVKAKAQEKIKVSAPGYDPNTGTTRLGNATTGYTSRILAARDGVLGAMEKGKQETWVKVNEDPKKFDPKHIERYNALRDLRNMEKMSRGGTTPGVMSPYQSGTNYSTQSGTNVGSALDRKAIESITSFGSFGVGIKEQSSNIMGQKENYGLFDKFFESYKFLGDLREKNRDVDGDNRRGDNLNMNPPDDYDSGDTGAFASGAWIGPPGDTDKQQTGLNMNLPGGIGTPIYAPRDLIYRTTGTDGKPAVGLDGTPDVRGPSGYGFGFYGAYRYKEGDKEYEVLLGHFRDMPYKGTKDGDIIPKGTLLGYQGASGRSKSRTNGVYPHITLHVNGIGFSATNRELVNFATSLRDAKGITPSSSNTVGAKLTGLASFYGGPTDTYWHGRKTASGQVYDENAFSTALKDDLPFGMYEVSHNGKTVLVRGNDRGNFGPGNTAGINPPKDLDLSYGAARALGLTQAGVGRVTYRRVGDLKTTGGGLITPSRPSKTQSIPVTPYSTMDAQSLRTSITGLMGDLGTTKKIFGQENISLEIIDGKLVIKDTRGLFGTGLFTTDYDTQGRNIDLLKTIQNHLRYELNKRTEERNKPGPGASGYGNQSSSDTTIIKETMIAMVPGPPQPVPFPVDRIVPIPVSSGSGENINFLLG